MIDPFYFKREFTPLYQMPKEDFINDEIASTSELVKSLDDKQKEDALCALAILNLVKGDYDEALKTLAGISQFETSEKLMTSGIIYFHQQKYEDAKKKLDRSLEFDYSNNLSHLYAGQVALKENDLGQARNHFTKAQSAMRHLTVCNNTAWGHILKVRRAELRRRTLEKGPRP